jgi:tetratricopeptide (TPR) repeat protein
MMVQVRRGCFSESSTQGIFRMRRWKWFVCVAIVLVGASFQGSLIFGEDETKSPVSNAPRMGLTLEMLAGVELSESMAAYRTGNVSEFARLLDDVTNRLPDLPSKEVLAVWCAMEAGRFPDAVGQLEIYIRANGQDPFAYLTFGELALRSGRFTDAWLQLQQAKTSAASNPVSESKRVAFETRLLQLLAETAERRQQWTTSVELYKQCLQRDPKSALPLIALSRIRVAQGDVTAALRSLAEARKLDLSLPQPELALALQLAQGPAWQESETWFQAGIKASDSSLANFIEYARWLLLHDRPSEIESIFKSLKEQDNELRDIRFLRGLTSRFLGNLQEAETQFSTLHQANPDDLESADQLALVLVEQPDEGKRARASQISETNLRRAPQIETTVATAAWIQFKLGSVDTADRMLGELARQTSVSPQTAYYISELLKHRGKTEDARQILESAVKAPGIFVNRQKAIQDLKATK